MARVSEWASTNSASFVMRAPRSEGPRSRHEGDLKAARAAETAASTSVAEAQWTDVMGVSSLWGVSVYRG